MCSTLPEPTSMTDMEEPEPSSEPGNPDGEGQVSEEKWLLQQRLAVRELIDTEVSYLHMLQLCASDIRGRLQQVYEWGHCSLVFWAFPLFMNVLEGLERLHVFSD